MPKVTLEFKLSNVLRPEPRQTMNLRAAKETTPEQSLYLVIPNPAGKPSIFPIDLPDRCSVDLVIGERQ